MIGDAWTLTFTPVPVPDIVRDVAWGGCPCAIVVAGDGRLISGDGARGGEDGERSRGAGGGDSIRPTPSGMLEEDAIWLVVEGQYVSWAGMTQSLGGKITPGGGMTKELFCFPGTQCASHRGRVSVAGG